MKIEKLLNLLELRHCTLRKIKGGTIGMMKGLRELHLVNFKCDFDSLRQVIADIGELSSLKALCVYSDCLVDVLDGIKLPKSLKKLHTSSGFANLEELLELENFSISRNEATTKLAIPPAASGSTIIQWINSSKLKLMTLKSMKMIIMVDSKDTMLPSSLTKLVFDNLDLERIPNLKNLVKLTELQLKNCFHLQEVQGLGGLKSLQVFMIYKAGKLTRIDGLGNLIFSSNSSLKELEISGCPLLRQVLTFNQRDSVKNESLLKMKIQGNQTVDGTSIFSLGNRSRYDRSIYRPRYQPVDGRSIFRLRYQPMDGRSIPRLSRFPRLKELTIGDISLNIDDEQQKQQQLLEEEIENLEELETLQVYSLSRVQILPSLSKLRKLRELKLADLPGLREIEGLGDLKSLKWLFVKGCISLERLPISVLSYSTMNSMQLDGEGCKNFIDVFSDLSPHR
ncbi:Disease resistance protein L6 [Linum perenne]